jgi:hypothetical protein
VPVINVEHGSSVPKIEAMLRPAVVALLCAGALAAQGRNRLELDVATQHLAHREAVASPLAYTGLGFAGSAAYTRRAWNRDLRLSLEVGVQALESSVSSGGFPQEEIGRFQLEFTAQPADSGGRRGLGPRLSADLAYRDYQALANGSGDFGYVFIHVAAGALIERTARVRQSILTYAVGVPLVGWVSRPYTDVRIIPREGMGWRLATPFTLQTVDLRVALTRSTRPNPRWRLVYHGYLALFDPSTPYRAFENSIGLRLTFGRLGAR